MPPAFVLSQDQTLHKQNLFIRKIWSKHYLFDLRLIMNFQGLHRTIQFSISLPQVRGAYRLIYHQFQFCQTVFWRFIKFFISFAPTGFNTLELADARSFFGAFYNIEPIFDLYKSILKLFSNFLHRPDRRFNQLLFRHHRQPVRRKTRYNISSRFDLSSQIFNFFYRFSFSPAQPPIPWEANRDII